LYRNEDKDIIKLFLPYGSSITVVFDPLASVSNSKGKPFSGGAKYKEVGKMCDFRVADTFASLYTIGRNGGERVADTSASPV